MRIAAAQINIEPGAVEENTAKMLAYIKEAVDQQSDIVVFPEMSDTGYDMPVILKTAQSWDGETMAALRGAAHRHKINVVAGVSERTPEGVFNSVAVIDRKGKIIGRYRKTHLVTENPTAENKFLEAGDALELVEIEEMKCGFLICHDIRFPELGTVLKEAGATLLFIPAAFPLSRLSHWKTLVTARAIENQLFVAACNRIGVDTTITFGGTSMIIDPAGTVLAKAGPDAEELVIADLDPARVEAVRSETKP